jgi:proline racemase
VRWSRVLSVVGCHAEGESGDVIVGGMGPVPGATMLDKRRYLAEHEDGIRRRILGDPRGGVSHSVNVVLPSNHPDAQYGYVIMESTEYPVMSGSNTMCVATVLLETGMLPMTEPMTRLVLESPAGLIELMCTCRDGKVTQVRFRNQPAFAFRLGTPVEVERVGTLTVDLAWGGMGYALVDARALGFSLTSDEARDLCLLGQRIKQAVVEQVEVVNPDHPEYPGITQTEFTLPAERVDGTLVARNAVVISPGRLDRSPCGTGTSARLAVMHARGQIAVGERFVHESVLGTRFDSVIEATVAMGDRTAVVPSVAGQAWITSLAQIGVDPTDPFPDGFRLADTWGLGPAGGVAS